MAQEWGIPPWEVEENLSLYWFEAYLELSRERDKELKKLSRKNRT
jgi:hypothetical protein